MLSKKNKVKKNIIKFLFNTLWLFLVKQNWTKNLFTKKTFINSTRRMTYFYNSLNSLLKHPKKQHWLPISIIFMTDKYFYIIICFFWLKLLSLFQKVTTTKNWTFNSTPPNWLNKIIIQEILQSKEINNIKTALMYDYLSMLALQKRYIVWIYECPLRIYYIQKYCFASITSSYCLCLRTSNECR